MRNIGNVPSEAALAILSPKSRRAIFYTVAVPQKDGSIYWHSRAAVGTFTTAGDSTLRGALNSAAQVLRDARTPKTAIIAGTNEELVTSLRDIRRVRASTQITLDMKRSSLAVLAILHAGHCPAANREGVASCSCAIGSVYRLTGDMRTSDGGAL